MFARVVKNLKTNYSLGETRHRKRTVFTEDNVITILGYYEANPTKSISNGVEDLGFSYSIIQKVLKQNGYKPYKVLSVQNLRDQDMVRRQNFCQEVLNRSNEDIHFVERILFTDECSFSTAGRHNKRNTHVWATQNPYQVMPVENQGHQTVNVWCGMTSQRILGPLFFEGSLTGERYLSFLNNEIREMMQGAQEILIWQQDGAPPHNTRAVTERLNDIFPIWIGKTGTILWPARSPDLSPLDFFLWGHLKQLVYKLGSNSIEQLKMKIRVEIDNLNRNPMKLRSVRQNFLKRIRLCHEKNGGHFEQFL